MGVNAACKRNQRKWGVSSGGGSAVSDVRGVLRRHKLSDLLGMSHVQDPERHASETDPWVWKLYAYLEDLQLWKHHRLPRPPSPGKRWKQAPLASRRDLPGMRAFMKGWAIFSLNTVMTSLECWQWHDWVSWVFAVVHNLQGCHCRARLKGHSTSPTCVRINDYSTGMCGVLPDDAQYQYQSWWCVLGRN